MEGLLRVFPLSIEETVRLWNLPKVAQGGGERDWDLNPELQLQNPDS